MEKAQGKLGIILSLVVIGFLLIVIIWAFSRPAATGLVAGNIREGSFISEPFELKAWVVNVGGVQVEIQNSGEEDYLIKSVEIENCGVTEYGRRVDKDSSELFSIKCELNENEMFNETLIARYSTIEDGAEVTAFGKIEDKV